MVRMHPDQEVRTPSKLGKVVSTDMKAVFSIVINGSISTRCSDAISSSSGGATDIRKAWGSAMMVRESKNVRDHT